VFGVLASAQGQILRATLDSAVNSSIFLNDADQSNIFGIAIKAPSHPRMRPNGRLQLTVQVESSGRHG
jgi:hypothetical protein